MPVPAEVSFELGALPLRADFTVALSGHSDERVRTAVGRLVRRLADITGIPIGARTPDGSEGASLAIHCGGAGEAVQSIAEDESYSLRVTSKAAELRAKSAVGVLRGLATFEQLVELGPRGFQIPAVTISDRPRFPWRGLLIDVCRHWQPIEVIKRNLDGMAAVKLNVLHWHLTEDQGFRVESKLYPKLHELGSDGHYFTQDQVREVGRRLRIAPEPDH